MANAAQTNLDLLVRVVADQARRELGETKGDVQGLTAAARELGQQGASSTAPINALATATGQLSQTGAKAASATIEQSNALASLTATAGRSSAAIAGVRDAVTGATTNTASMTAGMVAATREGQLWRGELERIRAQFNPLFAASRQYEMELNRISEAERIGALTAREAEAARERAAVAITPMNQHLAQYAQSTRGATAASANLMAQWNDIGMMAVMGQNPMMLALQQGTQVNQELGQLGGGRTALRAVGTSLRALINPMSLLTLGVIALGAAGVQALSKLKTETKSLEENISDLSDHVERVTRANTEARRATSSLAAEFGSAADNARRLLESIAEIERRGAARSLEDTLKSIASAGGVNLGDFQSADSGKIRGLLDIPRVFASDEQNQQVYGITSAIRWANEAKGLDQQIKAVETLRDRFEEAAKASGGISKEEDAFLKKINDALEQLTKLKGQDENAAANAAATKLIADLNKRVELADAEVKYGAKSAGLAALRNQQEREAVEQEMRRQGIEKGSAREQDVLARLRAAQAAEAAAQAAERAKAQAQVLTGINGEIALNQAILTHGENSLEVERLRTEQAKAQLRLKLQDLNASEAEISNAEKRLEKERALARAIKEQQAARQANIDLARMESDAAIKAAALRYGDNSIEVKRLQIDQARREHEQQLAQMTTLDEARKQQLRDAWERSNGLAGVDPFGTRKAARDILMTQQESLAKLRLEQSLIGQSEQTRSRILALYEAELSIRQKGIGIASDEARRIRENAVEQARMNDLVARHSDAWNDVRSSGEQAIDSIVEKLNSGDIEGALQGVADEISKTMLELAVSNPLKNALLGTNYGTLSDLGGLGGIWDRLTGKTAPADPAKLAAQAMRSVGTMQVQAGSVTISSMGAAGMIGGAAPANLAGLPGGLSGSASIQSQIWSFFAGKGLAPHQIAGIMGNIQRESGFDPFAVGDGDTSFGLFQHHGSRGQGLLSAVGGQAGLGNVQAQLEYVWKELLGPESAVLKRLMSATNVQDATSAFVGFERPQGWSMANQMGADGWATRLGAAQEALTKFSTTTLTSTANLGNLGQGFDAFGSALSQVGSGGAATGGGLFGALLGPILSGLGIPGFATGGNHMGGLRIVGENGPELEYTGPSTILPSDLTRRLLSAPAPAANVSSAPIVQFAPVLNPVNNSSIPIDMHVEETTDARGQRQYNLVMSDAVAAGISAPGGKAGRTLRSQFGVRKKGISRL